MGKIDEESFDFNNPKSFEKLIKGVSTKKDKKGFSVGDIVSFVMRNKITVALVAIYFLLCGLSLNVYWIFKLISLLINK